MGYFGPSATQFIMTFKAGAVMATKYVAVMCDTSTGSPYVVVATDGAKAIGVLLDTAAAVGDPVKVALPGPVVTVKANGAFAYGDALQSVASTGKVDTASADEEVLGIALEAATAQDDEVAMLLAIHTTQTS